MCKLNINISAAVQCIAQVELFALEKLVYGGGEDKSYGG